MCPQGVIAVFAAVATAAVAAISLGRCRHRRRRRSHCALHFSVVSAHKRHVANGHTFLFVQRVLLMLCAITCAHCVARTFATRGSWVCVLCVARVVIFPGSIIHPLSETEFGFCASLIAAMSRDRTSDQIRGVDLRSQRISRESGRISLV